MAFADRYLRNHTAKGISLRYDKQHNFLVSRQSDGHGSHHYLVENRARSQRLIVPKFLFDRFRGMVRRSAGVATSGRKRSEIRLDVFFRTQIRYSLVASKSHENEVLIRDFQPLNPANHSLRVAWNALASLSQLLYHCDLQHPSDLLERIVAYHKLFQFSFAESSTSITSELILRKDVLSQLERYLPSLGLITESRKKKIDDPPEKSLQVDNENRPIPTSSEKKPSAFRSRLGQKEGESLYEVDYETLFATPDEKTAPNKSRVHVAPKPKGKQKGPLTCFPLPLIASEIRDYPGQPNRCDFSLDEIMEIRNEFLADRESEFYIGFEIMDCVFRARKKHKTFRFPLYYLPVTIEESGRQLVIRPLDRKVFLNHLGLANTVKSFGSGRAGKDPLEAFFKSLLNQTFEVDDRRERVLMLRELPFNPKILEKTREILIGLPGENGKGGLWADLNLTGIECDLESVLLYKTPKPSTPMVWALERDLDEILDSAREEPEQYSQSLLGKFLDPEGASTGDQDRDLFVPPWIPGALPKSIRNLIERLTDHDLLLLEGPPGTGKTFTITNLLIHCVARGKRLLIVSDQKSAIDALTERLQNYLLGSDRQSPEARKLDSLWQAGIKVVDEIPRADASFATWANSVRQMLRVDRAREPDWPEPRDDLFHELTEIDGQIADVIRRLDTHMEACSRRTEGLRVAPQKRQPQQDEEIRAMMRLIKSLSKTVNDGERELTFADVASQFVSDREKLCQLNMESCFDYFALPHGHWDKHIAEVTLRQQWLKRLRRFRPTSTKDFETLLGDTLEDTIVRWLKLRWKELFPEEIPTLIRWWRRMRRGALHPLTEVLDAVASIVTNHRRLLELHDQLDETTWQYLRDIHDALAPGSHEDIPFVLELITAYRSSQTGFTTESVQDLLHQLQRLQTQHDEVVRERFLARLADIARRAVTPTGGGGTDRLTTILSLLDSLEALDSPSQAWPILQDLQRTLHDAYPVWICRKRAVPFLFPCQTNSFDLVIVDEATQCRVDDALPLLYRGRKLMAVGDELQTVLDKDSVIDDFLFRNFDLDEHLRTSQAAAIKGGGSHLFGLVKRIKQASVMLDEHYRCPPDIIEYSNTYVYDNELKVMQWTRRGAPSSVVVDYSEADAPASKMETSGKFRGVDTTMVDHYLDYVARTIEELEEEFGRTIDVENEVALCYFLMKNEVYIKHVKGAFLSLLDRGADVLDGAGAALQGKERNFIFYLWDVTRSNIKSFRQGDDPDKRKGELNVLMSRPKKRSYHFLHREFSSLSHASASITDYLWRTYQRQQRLAQENESSEKRPTQLAKNQKYLQTFLHKVLAGRPHDRAMNRSLKYAQFDVTVGDPAVCVDAVLSPTAKSRQHLPSVALVDLARFEPSLKRGQDVADYFFQLQRAIPKLRPCFFFLHELALPDHHSQDTIAAVISELVH